MVRLRDGMPALETDRPPATVRSGRFYPVNFGVLMLLHLSAFAAVWTGVSVQALAMCLGLYALRMFGITAGYHRYFAHRSYATGPVVRFVLAFLSLSTLQQPVRWWAAMHRDHHRFSDRDEDLHSPVRRGLLRSQLTWVFYEDACTPRNDPRDLDRFPEVAWLDRHWRMPFVVLCGLAYLLLGWQGVIVGVVWSTLGIYHATGAINSLAHMWGWRRYPTRDHSRNNALLALITFGEGWHNNHHHYMRSARQGFFWWEIDLTWIGLRALERLGLVWDLHEPPEHVRGEARARVDAPARG